MDKLAHVSVGHFREAQIWEHLGLIQTVIDSDEILLVFDTHTSTKSLADITQIFAPDFFRSSVEFTKEDQNTVRSEYTGFIHPKHQIKHELGLHVCTDKKLICYVSPTQFHMGPEKFGVRLKILKSKATVLMPLLTTEEEDLGILNSPSVESNTWENFRNHI